MNYDLMREQDLQELKEMYANDKNFHLELVTTHRNGNKTYRIYTSCHECNGTGRKPYYQHIEEGICFHCGGTGVEHFTVKILTEENYQEKKRQTAERIAKALAEAEERNAKIKAEREAKELARKQAGYPDVQILTMDGKPCHTSKWFTDNWGNDKRCITCGDDFKVFTSARTNRGLNKLGLQLNPNYKG